MTKKYHVFIGSTLDDLKAERRELVRILTEQGQVPVSLEDLEGDERDRLRITRKWIRESDYFLILAAHKYGPLEGKLSGLEGEYGLAVKYGVPVIALVIDDKARWKDSKKEKDPAALKALEVFKRRLRGHTWASWGSTAELRERAQSLLAREMSLNPRPGWVPGTAALEPQAANELARLSRENEDLRLRLKIEPERSPGELRNQMKRALKVLALNKVSLSFYYTGGENWENPKAFPYLRLFRLLVPELSPGKGTAELSHFLGKILNPDLEKTVRGNYPVPSNTVKKIMADFCVLGLLKQPGAGREPVWELSGYGKELYALYRTRQLERALAKSAGPR